MKNIEKVFYPINLLTWLFFVSALGLVGSVLFIGINTSFTMKCIIIVTSIIVLIVPLTSTVIFEYDRLRHPFSFTKRNRSMNYLEIVEIAIRKEVNYNMHGYHNAIHLVINGQFLITLTLFSHRQQREIISYLISKAPLTAVVHDSVEQYIKITKEKNLWKSIKNSIKEIR